MVGQNEIEKARIDVPVHFDIVDPAANRYAWTPSYLCILSPLNKEGARSVVVSDGTEKLTPGEGARALGVPMVAMLAACDAAGLSRKARHSLDELRAAYSKSGIPEGWLPKSQLIKEAHTCDSVYDGLAAEGYEFNVVEVGGVMFHSPACLEALIDYRIKRVADMKEKQKSEKKQYHAIVKKKGVRYKTHAEIVQDKAEAEYREHGLITTAKACELLGCSEKTLRVYIHSGLVKVEKKFGAGYRLYSEEKVLEARKIIAEHREPPDSLSVVETMAALGYSESTVIRFRQEGLLHSLSGGVPGVRARFARAEVEALKAKLVKLPLKKGMKVIEMLKEME